MKPWLGWGYFGFWQQPIQPRSKFPKPCIGLCPMRIMACSSSCSNVGVLGTALFAFILIRTIVLAVRCLGTPERALAISTISCCAGILLVGVSETVLLASNQSLTPVMFITGLMCEQAVQAAKRRRHYRIEPRRRSDRSAGIT